MRNTNMCDRVQSLFTHLDIDKNPTFATVNIWADKQLCVPKRSWWRKVSNPPRPEIFDSKFEFH
jgi:hypothetical protein